MQYQAAIERRQAALSLLIWKDDQDLLMSKIKLPKCIHNMTPFMKEKRIYTYVLAQIMHLRIDNSHGYFY